MTPRQKRHAGSAAVVALLAWLVLRNGGAATVLTFAVDLGIFAVQAIGIVGVALVVVFLSQTVRSSAAFDEHGAGGEMSTIRARIGTEHEAEHDAIAVAIQYAATTVLIALVMLAFFLVHDPS